MPDEYWKSAHVPAMGAKAPPMRDSAVWGATPARPSGSPGGSAPRTNGAIRFAERDPDHVAQAPGQGHNRRHTATGQHAHEPAIH
jgi:hypothetical protein